MTDNLRITKSTVMDNYHSNPDVWEFEHLHNGNARTKTWHELGLKRTRAPKSAQEVAALTGRVFKAPRAKVQRKYANVYASKDGTFAFQFQHQNETHRRTCFATEDAAARAYNAYVEAHGFDRVALDVDDNDNMEAAS